MCPFDTLRESHGELFVMLLPDVVLICGDCCCCYDSLSLSTVIVSDFVLSISGWSKRTRLRGPQPRMEIDSLFVLTCAKDCCHATLTIGIMSFRVSAIVIPILILCNTNALFAFVMLIFQDAFCSLESPTCQCAVPLGTPMQTCHCVDASFTHFRKGIWNRESWLSRSKNGFRPPSFLGNISNSSMCLVGNVGDMAATWWPPRQN